MNTRIDEFFFEHNTEKYELFKSQYLGKKVKVTYLVNGFQKEKEGTLEEISWSGVTLRQDKTVTMLPYSLKLEIDSF